MIVHYIFINSLCTRKNMVLCEGRIVETGLCL
jgi:hypothetical protein